MRYTALKTRYLSLLTLTYLEHSHSHSHLNIQTPNPHTIGGRKPVGVRRLSSAATSQLSHCLKRLKRRRCDLFRSEERRVGKECPTLTYIPFHVFVVVPKFLYVSLIISDYLIGLAFWAFPIRF